MRLRLALEPRARHAPVAVEREHDLGRLDPQRTPREATAAELPRVLVEPPQLREPPERLLSREQPLRLPVRETSVAANHGAIERRLAVVERQLDGDRQPVDVRAQAAEIVRQLGREHRRDQARHVRREAAAGGAAVERRAGRNEVRDVGDVDEGRFRPDRERVVVILCGVGVDREGRKVAEVDAAFDRRLRRVPGLELLPRPGLDEQRLEHVRDVFRTAENTLDPSAPTARPRHDEVACGRLADALAVEHERHARREVGLADDELAAARDLDDDALFGLSEEQL